MAIEVLSQVLQVAGLKEKYQIKVELQNLIRNSILEALHPNERLYLVSELRWPERTREPFLRSTCFFPCHVIWRGLAQLTFPFLGRARPWLAPSSNLSKHKKEPPTADCASPCKESFHFTFLFALLLSELDYHDVRCFKRRRAILWAVSLSAAPQRAACLLV